MQKLKEITAYLEQLAPLSSQESYDNSGLIIGDPEASIRGALLSLDCTEEIIDEAIRVGANLVIAHHPIVFKGLKKINGKNYVERAVIKAIKNDIALYAIHTNLDNYRYGVNAEIGALLKLEKLRVLAPKENVLHKIVVFCPSKDSEKVSKAMFNAGAGNIGDYDECSFELKGSGFFKPNDDANPTIGQKGKREEVQEKRVEVICSAHLTSQVVKSMQEAHPYEEVAYDIFPLLNKNPYEGAGMIGELPVEMDALSYLKTIKRTFNCGAIRHTHLVHTKVKKIAFCGGSGSFLIAAAKAQKADLYITGDVKYHEFFDAENKIIIADIGHFESEQFTPNLIHAILKKKFINFALHLSEVNTNPINYL